MKVFAILALVAACAVLAYSAPAPNAIEWPQVSAKVTELKDIMSGAVEQIKAIASSDNAEVGESIASKVDSAVQTATGILNRATAAIVAETLTEIQATELIGELRGNLARLKGTLTTDLALLTPEASEVITNGFETLFDSIGAKAEEIYALLREPIVSTTEESF